MILFMFIQLVRLIHYIIFLLRRLVLEKEIMYRQQVMQTDRYLCGLQPVNGVPQGDWEPVILLVTPKKQQLITVGGAIFYQ